MVSAIFTQKFGSTSEESIIGLKETEEMLTGNISNSGINFKIASLSSGEREPLVGFSPILMVPPVKINRTDFSLLIPRLSSPTFKNIVAGKNGLCAQSFFDAKQLIVFCDSVSTARGTGFDQTCS